MPKYDLKEALKKVQAGPVNFTLYKGDQANQVLITPTSPTTKQIADVEDECGSVKKIMKGICFWEGKTLVFATKSGLAPAWELMITRVFKDHACTSVSHVELRKLGPTDSDEVTAPPPGGPPTGTGTTPPPPNRPPPPPPKPTTPPPGVGGPQTQPTSTPPQPPPKPTTPPPGVGGPQTPPTSTPPQPPPKPTTPPPGVGGPQTRPTSTPPQPPPKPTTPPPGVGGPQTRPTSTPPQPPPKPTTPPPGVGGDDEAKWNKAKAVVVPLIKQVLATNPPTRQEITTLVAEALQKERALDFAGALQVFGRLAPLLKAQLGNRPTGGTVPPPPPPQSSKPTPPPPPPQSSKPKSPPPPPPRPTPENLTAAMNRLTPAITEAVKAHPERRLEIAQLVKDFQTEAKAKNTGDAMQILATLGRLLKTLKAEEERMKDLAPILQSLRTPMTVDAKFAEKLRACGLDPLKLTERWQAAVDAVNTLTL